MRLILHAELPEYWQQEHGGVVMKDKGVQAQGLCEKSGRLKTPPQKLENSIRRKFGGEKTRALKNKGFNWLFVESQLKDERGKVVGRGLAR